MKNKLSAAISAAIPFILLSTPIHTAQAADSVKVNDDGSLELTITANRRPLSIDKTLASVSVITRKDIEQSQTQDLVDLLRQQHGISVARTGGPGSQTSVFIRGTESDHVLVLLDGVRIASATSSFDWSQIPLDQIDRVEIVRGPRAALYGSDAIGGVIEITTRQKTTPYVAMTAGSFGTRKISTGFSSGDGVNHVSLNLARETTKGFSAKNAKSLFGFDADNDGHQKNSLGVTFSRQVTQKSKVGVELFETDNSVDIDTGHNDAELESISAYVETNVSDRWQHKLKMSHINNKLISSSGFSDFTTKRRTLDWQNNVSLSDKTSLIIGINVREESGKTASIPTEAITNKAIFANINHRRGVLNLDLSLRHDKHSQAGAKTTGQFSVGFDASDKTTVYANYGTGFRAPNINDLYYPGFFGSYAGNPNLKPETSETLELGVKSQLSVGKRMEVSLFQTKLKNMITNSSAAPHQSINIDKVSISGLELAYSAKHKKLNWGGNLSILSTKNKSTGKRLLRRPDRKLTLNLGYQRNDKTHYGADVSFVGSRSDVGNKELPGYTLLNLSADHQLTKHAKLGLRLENVTNKDYELAYGYNTPKRGAYLTFSYQ